MSDPTYDPDEQVTVIDGVPFDDITFARLIEVAEAAGAPMRAVISAIVRDVLEDDAQAHDEAPGIVRPNANHDLH